MDQFQGQVLYVEIKALEMAIALLKEGFKLGGNLAKAGLLLTLDKVKENKRNKGGLVPLKKLLQGEEGVSSFTIKGNIKASLEKQFTEMGIKYGYIENSQLEEVRFFVEDRRLTLVKSILEDMVKNEECLAKNMKDRKFVIKDIRDDEINYRHKIGSIDKDSAIILRDELSKKNIKAEMIMTGINKDNTLNLEYKVKAADKEKTIATINHHIKDSVNLNEKSLDNIIRRAKDMADSINNKNKEVIKDKANRISVRER